MTHKRKKRPVLVYVVFQVGCSEEPVVTVYSTAEDAQRAVDDSEPSQNYAWAEFTVYTAYSPPV